jgi:hypothetical protein
VTHLPSSWKIDPPAFALSENCLLASASGVRDPPAVLGVGSGSWLAAENAQAGFFGRSFAVVR